MQVKTWHVDVFLTESGDVTDARAVLSGDRPEVVTATAVARRNPRDPAVPEIGDEVAAGRALAALAQRLLGLSTVDIEASVTRPVH